jgi:hypothetical protein
MTQMMEPTAAPVATDLPTAVLRVLAASTEPMTPPKIRAALPTPHRQVSLEELTEQLRRQVASSVLYQYPKYRSQADRFWDRPMSVHIAGLLHTTLAEAPLGFSELRRKLPAYAQTEAEAILNEQVNQGKLHRHPRLPGTRGGDLFGVRPADAKDYLRQELPNVLRRLQTMGFKPEQLRVAALELLHDEQWAATATTSDSATRAEEINPETNPPQPR